MTSQTDHSFVTQLLFFLFLALLILSQVSQARTHLDLDDGTAEFCNGTKGEANALGFHAKITTTKKADGGLQVTVNNT